MGDPQDDWPSEFVGAPTQKPVGVAVGQALPEDLFCDFGPTLHGAAEAPSTAAASEDDWGEFSTSPVAGSLQQAGPAAAVAVGAQGTELRKGAAAWYFDGRSGAWVEAKVRVGPPPLSRACFCQPALARHAVGWLSIYDSVNMGCLARHKLD